MMVLYDDLDQRLKELKKAFDDNFASAAIPVERNWIELLLIVTGGVRLAVRMQELKGIEANRRIVPLPGNKPGLFGLSAVHGQLVPVFDLGTLLGVRTGGPTPRWMALHQEKELIALAFDHLEGSLRVSAKEVYARNSTPEQAHLTGQTVKVNSNAVYVVDIPSVVSAIRRG